MNTASAEPAAEAKRPRAFAFSLPALVQGHDSSEREFDEQIEMASLSSDEATFWLRTEVPTGAKLQVRLWVPRTLLLEKPLQVCLSGTVCDARLGPGTKANVRLVSVKLDNRFRIYPLFA